MKMETQKAQTDYAKTDYGKGQEAFYHDSGIVYKVKVLENNGNAEWERYKLKILRVVQESPIFKSSAAGEEITCEKKRDCGCCGGLWHLLNS